MSESVNKKFDIVQDIFKPIVERVKRNADSLVKIGHYQSKHIGIEGWLKVEVTAVLGDKIEKVRGRGADLLLKDKTEIELKAATDFNLNWIINDGCLKRHTRCLFLGDGSDIKKIDSLKSPDTFTVLLDKDGHETEAIPLHTTVSKYSGDINVIGCEPFKDGRNDWVIGMIEPKR